MPKGLKYIGEEAFADCSALEKIIIPKNVEWIGKYAFYCCTSLKKIVLHSYKGVSENTFQGCNIKDIVFSEEAVKQMANEILHTQAQVTVADKTPQEQEKPSRSRYFTKA